jgi:hypothetical protein
MGASVSNVYVNTYESTVRHLAQQGISRLRRYVAERSVQSEGHNWERLGTQEAVQKTTALAATPEQDYPWSRRKSIPVTYHTGDTVEQEDVVQTLVDPNSNIAMAQAKAMKRAIDDEIIAAATGDSRDGAGNAVTFPVAQNIGDGTLAINYDIVTETTEKFMQNDIDPDEPKVYVISPEQARKLLQLTEATSGDYNAVRPLTSQGYIESWMGYSWIVSTRLPDASVAQDGSEVYCFAMTQRAIGLQMNRDITAKVAEDPTTSFVWRIYCFATYGAIRVEDEQLVRVHLSTTI